MVAQLSVRSGPEKGKRFTLDRARPMHVGRGSTCEIVLTDPVSSRYHAVIYYEDGDWHVRDTSSRNGTTVNGQKVDGARLQSESLIRVGDTELQLVTGQDDGIEPATVEELGLDDTQTILLHGQFDEDAAAPELVASSDQLLDLYMLSLAMLRQQQPAETVQTVLQLLCDRTGADLVGLSYVENGETVRVASSIPADRVADIRLSASLSKRVIDQGESVWIRSDETERVRPKAGKNREWSEAIYVPLNVDNQVVGVMHLYRESSSFTAAHFDLVTTACRLVAIGIDRSHQHETMRAERQRIAVKNAIGDELVGECAAMQKLKNKLLRIGNAGGSVLIRGESGVGKELVARAVHRCSPRSKRPMVTVNCAAIPANLVESQLFGHKRGSFTGADNDHTGWFQQAHTGTLFLDEIGELPLEAQAKLLRILEGHPFLAVGGTKEITVDVRVIAATNRDLTEFVREKKFREDLYYRLSVFELEVPPLRDRGEDIELLIHHFFDHFRNQHGRPSLQLGDDALAVLRDYAWPGNIRQLRNVIDSAVVMADDPRVNESDLGIRDAGTSRLETLRIDWWEQRLIRKALTKTDGNVPEAAKLLGISRATAYRKITEYNIQR
ncbi:MAG: sigma 54-interacting transcriptional regulator [Planctomycetota bacterium]